MDLLRIPHHDAEFLDGFQIVRSDFAILCGKLVLSGTTLDRATSPTATISAWTQVEAGTGIQPRVERIVGPHYSCTCPT